MISPKRKPTLAAAAEAIVVTKAEWDVLQHAEHLDRVIGACLCTGWGTPKRVVLRLCGLGLLRELDQLVEMCDGDGGLVEPSRCRIGYELTESGRKALTVPTDSSGYPVNVLRRRAAQRKAGR